MRDSHITMPDGRTFAFSEIGDADGAELIPGPTLRIIPVHGHVSVLSELADLCVKSMRSSG
jgi:hypothetical protein